MKAEILFFLSRVFIVSETRHQVLLGCLVRRYEDRSERTAEGVVSTATVDDLSLLPFEWWMSFGSVSKMLMNLFLIFYLLILYFIIHIRNSFV